MALHNIKIIVVDGGRAGSYKEKNASGGSDSTSKQDVKSSKLYQMFHAKETIKSKLQTGNDSATSSATVMAFQMGTQLTKQIVTQSANYYISDIGRKNGDSNYQQQIDRQIEVVSDYLSFGGSVLSGAATGSMFGIAGAAVGTVAGAVSSGVSLAFKYAERERTYQWQMFKDSNSQTYNLARTSYQGFTGRLR